MHIYICFTILPGPVGIDCKIKLSLIVIVNVVFLQLEREYFLFVFFS